MWGERRTLKLKKGSPDFQITPNMIYMGFGHSWSPQKNELRLYDKPRERLRDDREGETHRGTAKKGQRPREIWGNSVFLE